MFDFNATNETLTKILVLGNADKLGRLNAAALAHCEEYCADRGINAEDFLVTEADKIDNAANMAEYTGSGEYREDVLKALWMYEVTQMILED